MEQAENKIGIVAYTDGGASPNPGPTGSGIHLYTYHYPTDKERPTNVGTRWIATDRGYVIKALLKNETPVVIDHVHEFAVPLGIATNNVGELSAVIYALLHIQEYLPDTQQLLIISDSKLTLSGIEGWLDQWKQRHWKTANGDDVKNIGLWKQVDQLLTELRKTMTIDTMHVLGHNDDYGNVLSDWLATVAVTKSAKSDHAWSPMILPWKDFKSIKPEYHDFLCLNRFYLNTHADTNTPGIYYQTDAGAKHISGKRTPEAVYSVVFLKTPDRLIEGLIRVGTQRETETNRIAYIKADRLNIPTLARWVGVLGDDQFIQSKKNLDVLYADKRPIIFEVPRGELELRMVDVLGLLEEVLEHTTTSGVRDGKFTQGDKMYQVKDITDVFYETVQVSVKRGKVKEELETSKLVPTITQGMEKITFNTPLMFGEAEKDVFISLLLGRDIPTRNTLARIETLRPTVLLVAWPLSDQVLQYGVVVQSDEAVGIWSNYFANLLLPSKGRK